MYFPSFAVSIILYSQSNTPDARSVNLFPQFIKNKNSQTSDRYQKLAIFSLLEEKLGLLEWLHLQILLRRDHDLIILHTQKSCLTTGNFISQESVGQGIIDVGLDSAA